LTEFFRAIFKVVAKMAVAKPIPVHFWRFLDLNLSSDNVQHGIVKVVAFGAMAIGFSREFTFLTEFFRASFRVVAKMAVAKPILVHFDDSWV
jgi:hypothetical protein